MSISVKDGSNAGEVNVKPASTAAVASDKALVVTLSPNNGAKITDGTNTAAVKAASTPAVATDPALVVSISSANSAVKVGDGTNNIVVKPASTPAAQSDPAAVVALSPITGNGMSQVTDVASAAITTTTTTSAITQGGAYLHQFVVPVTAVSGTSPTLDIAVQVSDDGGTNWYTVYELERITATGVYRTPPLQIAGNRVRFVQTIGGTTPSFTRSIQRNSIPFIDGRAKTRRIFDRAVSLTTLSAVTGSLYSEGCSNAQLVIALGAATTPPALQLQISEDGTNWASIGSPLAGIASSTVQVTIAGIMGKFVRAVVTTAGATVTPNYVCVKAW